MSDAAEAASSAAQYRDERPGRFVASAPTPDESVDPVDRPEMNRQGRQERQEEKKILASLASWRFEFLLFRAVSTRLPF
ncbi:hypothetical protein [Sorangium sp. So ce1024]|uniref:hypothetical protein n=1 Tax=unclassified Sorangium TaxID=2621164 RepID=UPI003F06695C